MTKPIKTLVELTADDEHYIHTTARWRDQEGEGKVYCPKCGGLYHNRFPEPIDIVLSEYPDPDKSIGGPVYFTPISIYHRDFIYRIREYLPETEFALGRCFDIEGRLIEDYITCYSRKYLIVRSGPGSEFKLCPECNNVRRMRYAPPYEYIPRFYLTDARIYMKANCRLFIDEELALQLDYSPWPVKFQSYRVLDKAIDGQRLPIDP
jgi:uncharacterized C2H2 Zn-finger protein